jgi:hypothetical protein
MVVDNELDRIKAWLEVISQHFPDWGRSRNTSGRVVGVMAEIENGHLQASLGTSVTNWLIVPAPNDKWWMWSSRWNQNWQGNRSTRRKPAPVPLCPPQIPHDMTWPGTQVAAVGTRRITSWAMARPWASFLGFYVAAHPITALRWLWVPSDLNFKTVHFACSVYLLVPNDSTKKQLCFSNSTTWSSYGRRSVLSTM